MALYAFSICASRFVDDHIVVEHQLLLCTLKCADRPHHISMNTALEEWPEKDSWIKHEAEEQIVRRDCLSRFPDSGLYVAGAVAIRGIPDDPKRPMVNDPIISMYWARSKAEAYRLFTKALLIKRPAMAGWSHQDISVIEVALSDLDRAPHRLLA